MIRPLRIVLLILVLCGLPLASSGAFAAEGEQPAEQAELSQQDITAALKDYQKDLDDIKQQVSKATTDNQLSKLQERTQQLAANAEQLLTDLQPMQDKLKG
ncbi:DUF3772 domain-containing protein, partial [Serratia rubidaea]|nr:DUF3772 domain-containing protein [Serratia rubidaea]